MTTLGPRRAQIIAKRMVYSRTGDIAFTVAMLDEYLNRHWIGTDRADSM